MGIVDHCCANFINSFKTTVDISPVEDNMGALDACGCANESPLSCVQPDVQGLKNASYSICSDEMGDISAWKMERERLEAEYKLLMGQITGIEFQYDFLDYKIKKCEEIKCKEKQKEALGKKDSLEKELLAITSEVQAVCNCSSKNKTLAASYGCGCGKSSSSKDKPKKKKKTVKRKITRRTGPPFPSAE